MTTTGSIIVTESVKNISPGSGLAFEPLGTQEFGAADVTLELFSLIGQ